MADDTDTTDNEPGYKGDSIVTHAPEQPATQDTPQVDPQEEAARKFLTARMPLNDDQQAAAAQKFLTDTGYENPKTKPRPGIFDNPTAAAMYAVDESPIGDAIRSIGHAVMPTPDAELPANKATQDAISKIKEGFPTYADHIDAIGKAYSYGQLGPLANTLWQDAKIAGDVAKVRSDLHPAPTFGEAVASYWDSVGTSLHRQFLTLDNMLANLEGNGIEAQVNAQAIKQDLSKEQRENLTDNFREGWKRDLYVMGNAIAHAAPMLATAIATKSQTAGAAIMAFQSAMDRASNAIAQGKSVQSEFNQAGIGAATGFLYSLMPMSVLKDGFGAAALKNSALTVLGGEGSMLVDKMIDMSNEHPEMSLKDVVTNTLAQTNKSEFRDGMLNAISMGLVGEAIHAAPDAAHNLASLAIHAKAGPMTEEHAEGLASIPESIMADPAAQHNAVVSEGAYLPDETRPTEKQQKVLDAAAQKLPKPENPDERTAEQHARIVDPEAFRIRDNLNNTQRTRETWLRRDFDTWMDQVSRSSPYYEELERLLARMQDPEVSPMKRAQARKRAEETTEKHDAWVAENTQDVPPHIQEHIEELDNIKRSQIDFANTNRVRDAFQEGHRRQMAAQGEREQPEVTTEPLTVEEPKSTEPILPPWRKEVAGKSLADQRRSMIAKAQKAMTDAGYPEEYAAEYAKLAADHYFNRAMEFNGALGTPEEHFDAEFPTIRALAPKTSGKAKKGVVSALMQLGQEAVRKASVARFGHKEGTLFANLSAATESIPAINDLRLAAMGGDEQAADMLRQFAKNTMERLLSGVASAKIETDGKTGLYGGEVEPSLGAKITFAERDREQVVKALVRTAQLYKQQEVHIRGDATGKVGKVYNDGSFNTLVYRFTIPREFSREEIQKIIDESGLAGLTFDGRMMEAYYVGRPEDTAAIERFERNIERASDVAKSIGGGSVEVEESLERLWRYGQGRGTINYRKVQGELRTPTPRANENARLVIARHLGEEPQLAQPKKVTPQQALLQRLIAHAYELMPDNDIAENKLTKKAYEHLSKVVLQQLKAMPIEFEAWTGKGEPYQETETESPSDQMRRDVEDNHHMWYYPTEEGKFGPEGVDFSGHPLLEKTGIKDKNGRELLVNDALRIVHDYYAHTPTVAQFGPVGEEAAWKNHMASISDPWARWALTSETRGQNSWVNFRPEVYGQGVPVKMRGFARQKAALLPIEYAMTGDDKVDAPMKELAKTLSAEEKSGSIDEKDMVKAENLPEPGKPPLTEQRVKWDLTPEEHAITENDILNGERHAKTGTVLVRDIAKKLMDRGIEARKKAGYPAVIEGPSLKTDSLLSRLIASMTKNALLKGEQEGGRTAIDWYKKSVEECMRVVRMMHPEMANDPHAEMVYRLGMAITSQGEKVPSNFRLAEEVYDQYKNTGRFPEDIRAKEQNSMNDNFHKLNVLIDEFGGDLNKLKEFLHTEHTVRQLEALGWKPDGSKDEKVYGSAILGAKIGQGFYQNLSGNLKPLTVDMWFMRTWGRITGTLVGNDLEKPTARFTKALQDEGHDVPKSARGLLKRAQEIVAAHEKHYKANAQDYRSKKNPEGKFVKSELTKAAEAYEHNSIGINEGVSSAGQRQWIRNVVDKARRQLAAEGIHLDNAQLQAIIWYPEKTLYDRLGGDPEITNNVDYSQSAQEFARKKGHSEDDIKAAVLGTDERGSERSAAGDTGGAAEAVRQEPQQPSEPEVSGGGGRKSVIPPLLQDEVGVEHTPKFKKWFRDSKVVDASGKPLVVYHGTKSNFDTFTPGVQHFDESGYAKHGSGGDPTTFLGSHFAEEPSVANQFARGLYGERVGSVSGGNVMPVYLKVERPFETSESAMREEMLSDVYTSISVDQAIEDYAYNHNEDSEDSFQRYNTNEKFRSHINEQALIDEQQSEETHFDLAHEMAEDYRAKLKSQGYDGIKYKNEIEGGWSWAVFSPEQIKSVFNIGSFDPSNENILKQGPKGMIDLIQPTLTRARMTLITGRADASTFIHEISHQWLDETLRYAQHPNAPGWLKQDALAIRQWLQLETGYRGKGVYRGLSGTQHEVFARAVERLFYEGTAPTQAMVPVFQRFKQWFRKVYAQISDIYGTKYAKYDKGVPKNVQDIISRMLIGSNGKPVVASPEGIGSEFSKIHTAEEKMTPPGLAGHVADMQESEIDAVHAKHNKAGHDKVKEAENRSGKTGGVTAPSGSAAGAGAAGSPEGRAGNVPEPSAVPAVGAPPAGESGQARAGAAGATGTAGTAPRNIGTSGDASRSDAKPDTSAKRGPWDREKYDLGNTQSKNMNSGQFNDFRDVQQFMIDTYRSTQGTPEGFGDHDVVSDEELMRTAQAAGLPQEEMAMNKIRALSNANGVPMAAYVRIAIKMFGDKAKIAKDAAVLAQRTGKEEDIAKFMEARGEFLLVAKTLSKGANEIGRSLRAFRDMSKAAEGQAANLSRLFQEMDGLNDTQRKKMIEQAALLQTDGQLAKFMQDSQKKSFGQNIVAYRINALISGPLTHFRYAIGNLINAVYEPLVKTPVAATIGSIRAAVGQDVKDRVYFGEALAQIGAMTKGSADGWKAAAQAWRDYQSPALPGERAMLHGNSRPYDIGELRRMLEMPGITDEQRADIKRQIAQSAYDKFVSQPSRSVAAIHSFFKSLRYEQNIQKLAFRQAMREGLEGAARDTRIAELTMSPTEDMMAFAQMKDPMQAVAEHFAINTGRSVQELMANPTPDMKDFLSRTMMVKEATADALKQLYMAPSKYDSFMGRAISWSNSNALIKCMIPFMKIGTQIETLAMVEGTPLAFANEEYRQNLLYREGGAKGDEQWSAMAIGMSMMGLGFYLASQGDITGDGPIDAAQRRVWLLTHSPNTINIGGLRLSYKGLGYLGIQLRVMANLFETAHYHTGDDIAKYTLELLGATGKTVLDDNWMKGVKDFVDMIYGDEEEQERWAKQAVSNALPYSIGLGQTARMIDPYYRQADGVVQSILNNVPFASETLSPKYDVFGNPIRRDGPMYENDLTAQTLERLGLGVSQVPKTIHGIALNQQQRDDYQQHGGFLTKKYLDALISQPGFGQLTPGDQVSEIKRLIAKGHKSGRDYVMMKYREDLYPQILANKRTYMQTGKKVKAQ